MSKRAPRSRCSVAAIAGMACAAAAAALAGASCRGAQPSATSASAGYQAPVVLVTPETGPSELQARLASLSPTPSGPPDDASQRLDRALDAFHARTPAHRGYIAVDKPLYQPGEVIWFRGFDLASASLAGGGGRAITTFQLVSPRGDLIAEKSVLDDDGGAGNDFELPVGLAGGEYVLKASSTSGAVAERHVIVAAYQAPRIKKKLEFLRKAYGPGDTVAASVAVHRATGEALADKAITGLVTLDGAELARVPITTDPMGNAVIRFALPAHIARGDGLLTVLVEDGGVTESIQKRVPITLADLQLALYPEGGDLVVGLPGRVYFAATNLLDKPADIEGRVVDDHDVPVALLRSHHDGMGRFELTPQPGRSYRVEITRPTGIGRAFAVPAAVAAGCSMQALDDVGPARDDLRVAVWCTRSQPVVTTAVLRDARVATATAVVRAGEPAVLALAMPAAAQGAVRVTLFDRALAPQAERLIYRRRGADLRIAMTPDRSSYQPRDRVTLAIETRTPDGQPIAADLAMSVVDDTVLSFADDKQATMLARLYLEAELPGQKIEEPNFYFGDDAKAPAALDLVLGTHGWRRFEWKPVFETPEPTEPPIEDDWAYEADFWRDDAGGKRGKARVAAAEDQRAARDMEVRDDQNEEGAEREPEAKAMADEVAPPPPSPPVEELAAAQPPDDLVAQIDEPMMQLVPGAMDDDVRANFAGEMIMIEGGAFGTGERDGFAIGEDGGARHRIVVREKNRDDDRGGTPDPYANLYPERVFAQPSYEQRYDGPRTDFRETVFWASRVRTGADGKGEVSFYLSDAVTSFRATAEGVGAGALGRGEALVQSKLPVSLAVKMPLEVSAGDRLRLPVTVTNETAQAYSATLTAHFGKAFRLVGDGLPPQLALAAGERRSSFYELEVVGDGRDPADGAIAIAVVAANLRDQVARTIAVAPLGFPQEVSIAGTISKQARHEILVSDVVPGSMRGTLTLYPSPLATMIQGTEAILREPSGCFEQASSANYPNIMVLDYLEQQGAAEPALIERTQDMLENGYRLLTGYESPEKGYEWFGGDPGHEALTAYGLLEFHAMARVFDDVDDDMVARTSAWLRGRRDGTGGYRRNDRALDSFGSASPEVTDAYITYALTAVGGDDLDTEIERQRQTAATTKDPYVLALATNTLLEVAPKGDASRAALARLRAMQSDDGSFPGADHSITRSGGDALLIETTALAVLAMLAADGDSPPVRLAIDWLNGHRDGFGGYSSTQSTVLALQAMARYAAAARRAEASGTVAVSVNGVEVGRLAYEQGHRGAITFELADQVRTGKNVIEIALDSTQPLPYSAVITWGSKVPATSPRTKVDLTTKLARTTVPLGEGVRMDVHLANTTDAGIPMTMARIGLPGGLTFQTWQLQELRDRKQIDFYETRAREVILYFRSLGPKAAVDLALELKAEVPGSFVAPASSAYLYYTDEDKRWAAPSKVTIVP